MEDLDDFNLEDGDLVKLNPHIVDINKKIEAGNFWSMNALIDKFKQADRENAEQQ